MEHTSFHEWLAGRMDALGMTPTTLAEKMRGEGYTVARQSASHWRQGRCKPAPKLWAPLAYALGVSPADVAAVLAADAMGDGS